MKSPEIKKRVWSGRPRRPLPLAADYISSMHHWRLRYGSAVGASVGASVIYLRLRVMQHGLSATHGGGVFTPHVEFMAHRGKFLPHFRRHSRLDHNVAPTLWTHRETRGLERLLDVHAVINHVRNKLRVRQRLVRPSHDSETDMLIPMFHESWNDGVERPLSRSQRIR